MGECKGIDCSTRNYPTNRTPPILTSNSRSMSLDAWYSAPTSPNLVAASYNSRLVIANAFPTP